MQCTWLPVVVPVLRHADSTSPRWISDLFYSPINWFGVKWNLLPRSKFATKGFQMARRRKISWSCNQLHPSVQCMCLFSTLYFSCICCPMLSKYINSIWKHVIQRIKKSWGNYNIGLKHKNIKESGSHRAIIVLFHFRWSEISNCLLKGSVISHELPKRGRVPEELLKKRDQRWKYIKLLTDWKFTTFE